jgi:hypothetical protein
MCTLIATTLAVAPLWSFDSTGTWQGPSPLRMRPGTSVIRTPHGVGIDFSGPDGGIMFDDLPQLGKSGSLTVVTWLYPRAFAWRGPNAQIFFRGDDRNGLDSYSLCLRNDGRLHWIVQGADQGWSGVSVPITLNRWVHVVASFDSANGTMRLFVNGSISDSSRATVKPLGPLDPQDRPGVGVGNVQTDQGPHHQPFDGMLSGFQVFDQVVRPPEERDGLRGCR